MFIYYRWGAVLVCRQTDAEQVQTSGLEFLFLRQLERRCSGEPSLHGTGPKGEHFVDEFGPKHFRGENLLNNRLCLFL